MMISKGNEVLSDELHSSIATKEDIAHFKAGIIKWMFFFFVIQIIAIAGLYLKT